MITIHENPKSRFLNDPGRTADCPHCNKELAFYGIAPDRCANCKATLINFLSVLNSHVYRLNYHTGIVDEQGYIGILAG